MINFFPVTPIFKVTPNGLTSPNGKPWGIASKES